MKQNETYDQELIFIKDRHTQKDAKIMYLKLTSMSTSWLAKDTHYCTKEDLTLKGSGK